MAQESNREKLLEEGLRLMHRRGFGASSVRDIVEAAGVPQGSFTNHFTSKEAFGLAIVERYHEAGAAAVARTLRNDALPPLSRLRAWMEGQLAQLRACHMRNGCLYGNFSVDASEHSEAIRRRVSAIFDENKASVAYCLTAAVRAGELDAGRDVDALAGFIVSSLQGAILVARAQRSPEPLERFIALLFDDVLRPKPTRARTAKTPRRAKAN